MPPHHHKFSRLFIVLVSILGAVTAAAIIIIVLIITTFTQATNDQTKQDQAARTKLTAQLAALPAARGCHETSRTYIALSLDTQSHWNTYYNCTATAGPTYSNLIAELKAQGYSETQNYFTAGPNYFYSFTYRDGDTYADVNFTYPDGQSHTSTNPATLTPEPIAGYTLSLSDSPQ